MISESAVSIVESGPKALLVFAAPASPLGAPTPTYSEPPVVRENSSRSATASSALPVAAKFVLHQLEPRPGGYLGLQLAMGNGPQASAEGVSIGGSLGIALEMPNGHTGE